jgi:Cytochrome oxidase complex assembly protein 1
MNTPVHGMAEGASVPRPRTWFGRNWKWFAPLLAVATLLVLGLFIVGSWEMAESFIRSSEPYRTALQRAQDSPLVAIEIGLPFRERWYGDENIQMSGDSGYAELSIPITGPNGKGRIVADARERHGIWMYRTLEVDVDGQDTPIPLLTPEITALAPAKDSI